MFGEGLDPVPFISGAYLIGAGLLLGFGFWHLLQRKKLRMLEEVIQSGDSFK